MTLTSLFILVTLTSCYTDLESQKSLGSQGSTKTTLDVYEVTGSDNEKLKHLYAILKSLQALKVLDPNTKSCYALSKILKTKTVENLENDEWKVEFIVRGLHHEKDTTTEEIPSRNDNGTISSQLVSSNRTNSSIRDSGQQSSKQVFNSCYPGQGIASPADDHDGDIQDSGGANNKKTVKSDRGETGKNGIRVPYKRKYS